MSPTLELPRAVREESVQLNLIWPVACHDEDEALGENGLSLTLSDRIQKTHHIFAPTDHFFDVKKTMLDWMMALSRLKLGESMGFAFSDSVYREVVPYSESLPILWVSTVWVTDFMKRIIPDTTQQLFEKLIRNVHKIYQQCDQNHPVNQMTLGSAMLLVNGTSIADRVLETNTHAVELIGMVRKFYPNFKGVKLERAADFFRNMDPLQENRLAAYAQFQDAVNIFCRMMGDPYIHILFLNQNGVDHMWKMLGSPNPSFSMNISW